MVLAPIRRWNHRKGGSEFITRTTMKAAASGEPLLRYGANCQRLAPLYFKLATAQMHFRSLAAKGKNLMISIY
jgi:hypothetical protein